MQSVGEGSQRKAAEAESRIFGKLFSASREIWLVDLSVTDLPMTMLTTVRGVVVTGIVNRNTMGNSRPELRCAVVRSLHDGTWVLDFPVPTRMTVRFDSSPKRR